MGTNDHRRYLHTLDFDYFYLSILLPVFSFQPPDKFWTFASPVKFLKRQHLGLLYLNLISKINSTKLLKQFPKKLLYVHFRETSAEITRPNVNST